MAPMVDVTDLPYRLVCREQGAAIGYTEMINIGAIFNENEKTLGMLKTSPKDSPIGLQVTGRSVGEFESLAERKELRKFDLVDINCGCPSSRIIGNQSGSFLLKSPKKIGDMIRALKKNSDRIVTAKIRLGINSNNVLKISKEIEKAGADLLTIHARLASQKYDVPPDWKWIKKVKREIGIPVVGNGGVVSGESAAEMLDIADGAMIASAAIGDPGIFDRVLCYLRNGKEKEPDYKSNLRLFVKYLDLAKKHQLVEIPRIKYLGGKFLRGFQGAPGKRQELMGLDGFTEIRKFVSGLC